MRKKALLGLVSLSLALPSLSMALDDEEKKFGFYQDRWFVSSRIIVFNEALNRRITEIGNRVTRSSNRGDIKYTFRVINDPVVGAYAVAGGFVYINTGLLDILESEDELAAIMGHEIAHINESHQIKMIKAYERGQTAKELVRILTGQAFKMLFGELTTGYIGSYNVARLDPYVQSLGETVGYKTAEPIAISMIKGYGKRKELEADALGIQYINNAGYDPNALISVFKKLISIRNRLRINDTNYASCLINAEPGLEERMKNAYKTINRQKKEEERIKP